MTGPDLSTKGDSQALNAGRIGKIRLCAIFDLALPINDMSSMKIDVLPFKPMDLCGSQSCECSKRHKGNPFRPDSRQHGGKFFWPINADVAAAVGCLHGQLRLGLLVAGKVSTLPGEGEQGRQR
jgi:hypothetical protein